MTEIDDVVLNTRTIAIVGLSDNPERPSYGVAQYMLQAGYTIYPINPSVSEILGQKSYASLADLPETVDLVNVFRRSEAVPEIADEAIAHGAKALWLQLGVSHPEAEAKAKAAGLKVVSNHCLKIAHMRLP